MKQALFLLAALACYGQTGSRLAGPVVVLPNAARTQANALELMDTGGHFTGFLSPSVTQIVVSSATAANPMVLTLANPRPTTIAAGGTVTVSGAAGAGCTGMNGTFTVSAVGGSTITAAHNNTGCTYTANSASINTSIYWQLPAVDGVSGKCFGWTAPYVLDFITCSGGSGLPVPDTTVITQNSADPTKQAKFSNASIATGTIRTYTFQDGNYKLAGTDFSNNFTANQTLTGINVTISGTVNVGSGASDRIAQLYSYTNDTEYTRYINYGVGAEQYFVGQNTTSATLFITDHLSHNLMEWDAVANTVRAWGNLAVTNATDCTVGGTCYYTGFAAPTLSATTVYTMPTGDGTAGQVLATNGSKVLSWASGAGLPVLDSTVITQNAADHTKQAKFSNASISTGTIRTYTFQDGNYKLAGTDFANNFTSNQTLTGINVILSGTVNIGSGATDRVNVLTTYQTVAEQFQVRDYAFGSTQYVIGKNATSGDLFLTDQLSTQYQQWASGANRFWQPVGVTNSTSCTLGGACYMTGFKAPASALSANQIWEMPNVDGTAGNCWGYSAAYKLGWTACSGLTNPMTTLGDTIYGGVAGVPTRLGIGSTGQIYTVSGGSPSWISLLSPLLYFGGQITIQQSTTAQDGYLSAADWNTFNGKVSTSRTISTTSPLTGGGSLAGNLTLACSTCMVNPMTTAGDTIIGFTSGAPIRLGIGSTGQIYTVSGGSPSWISMASPLSYTGGLIQCTTCVTSVTGTSPISSSGGTTPAISCSTCVTTAGGQTIGGALSVTGNLTLGASASLLQGANTFIDGSGNIIAKGGFYVNNGTTYTGQTHTYTMMTPTVGVTCTIITQGGIVIGGTC